MNILLPHSWLIEHLDTNATPSEMKEFLSLCGPSVERMEKVHDDVVYEIEVTSNRVDMASVIGIAREAAAILPRFGKRATTKKISIPQIQPPQDILPLEIVDPDHLCDRLLAIVFDNMQVAPAPEYMKDRLEKSGVRSLNTLIDITNYVMLELGHPCHVFDYDRIKTAKLILRKAKKGEKLITLDRKTCELTPEDVVIDDGTGRIIDLPGIMGTENSVVTSETRRAVLFIESNNPSAIRKTSMRLGLRTLAATMNEKHPDPEGAKTTILRACELFQKHAHASVKSTLIDLYPGKTAITPISTTVQFINSRLGITLELSEIVRILQSLSFDVTVQNDVVHATPPSFRQFDVKIEEDIVEEVARIYGYHNLPSRIMDGPIPVVARPTDLIKEEKIKNILKYWGYTETYHYSFVSKELLTKAELKPQDHLKLANPLTTEIEYMRISLLPSLIETTVKNLHVRESLQLFELSKVYVPQKNSLPCEISELAVVSTDDFFHVKGIVEGIFQELGITDFHEEIFTLALVKNRVDSHFYHPQQSLVLLHKNEVIGIIGKLHPTVKTQFNSKKDLYIASIDLSRLFKLKPTPKKYTTIPQFPAVIEDITITRPAKSYIGPIIESIYKQSTLVSHVEVVSNYKETTTLRISYVDTTKNLKTEDIGEVRKKIVDTLSNTYHSTIKI